ncbi:MAG: selenium-dependent molybdenum hydroxylase 1, partial [Acidobacteria bacterium]|nr:selenium-dependent molybdenum hydroxylase 1 [Acidobacteriota bacterium]
MPEVTFTVNGKQVSVGFDDGETLLDVLRDRLGLVAAKDGCSQGTCGSCTVLVDGRPALACLKPPAQLAGREVITLEGLPERQRQLLARAFVQEGAVQCGYCTPGLVMRAACLLDRGTALDRAAVAKALDAHVCRCTGYLRVADAIASAGEAWRDGADELRSSPRRGEFFGERHGRQRAPGAGTHGVGASLARYRGIEAALGEKPFVADLAVPGMLHGALVLAPHPRARV